MSTESTSNREKPAESRLEELLSSSTDLKTSLAAIVREVAADVKSISQYHGIHAGNMIPTKTSYGRNEMDLRLDAFESKWGMHELFAEKEKTGRPIDLSTVISKIIYALNRTASRRLAQLLINSPAEQRPALLEKWLDEMRKTFIGLTDIYDREGRSHAFMSYLQNFSSSTMLKVLEQVEEVPTEVDRTSEVLTERIRGTI